MSPPRSMLGLMDADLCHRIALAAKRLHDRGEAQAGGVVAALTWISPLVAAPEQAALCLELRLSGARRLSSALLEAWLVEVFGRHQLAQLELVAGRAAVTARLYLDASGRAVMAMPSVQPRARRVA